MRREKGGRAAQEVPAPGNWMPLSFPTDRQSSPLSVVLVDQVFRLPLVKPGSDTAVGLWWRRFP